MRLAHQVLRSPGRRHCGVPTPGSLVGAGGRRDPPAGLPADQPITEAYFPGRRSSRWWHWPTMPTCWWRWPRSAWEGMVGLSLFLRAGGNPHAAFCQRAGPATRLGADDLRRALTHDPSSYWLRCSGQAASLIRSTRGIVTIIGRAPATDAPPVTATASPRPSSTASFSLATEHAGSERRIFMIVM